MSSSKFFMIPNRRCPCICGGNGALIYLACPGCGRVVLVCDEIGNLFDNLTDLMASSPLVIWRSAAQRCPGCKALPLASFVAADEQQLLVSGVATRDFVFTPGFTSHSLRGLVKG